MISERDIIYITKKQASVAVVTLALFCLLIFMLGYFWGKQSVLEGFGQRVAQDSMNDQADYLSMMQTVADRTRQDAPTAESVENVAAVSEDTDSDQAEQPASIVKAKDVVKDKKEIKAPVQKKYSAVLVGFGSKQSALNFINRLQGHDIVTQIRTRISKTASGKTKKTWYQVITKSYESRQELDDVIERIKKFERLKDSDIKII